MILGSPSNMRDTLNHRQRNASEQLTHTTVAMARVAAREAVMHDPGENTSTTLVTTYSCTESCTQFLALGSTVTIDIASDHLISVDQTPPLKKAEQPISHSSKPDSINQSITPGHGLSISNSVSIGPSSFVTEPPDIPHGNESTTSPSVY
ncbi:unnamed protein product [Camellia sinensis]